MRGHITGVTDTALWTAYARGERTIYGHELPDGLSKNDALPTPIITPTTKGAAGEHDVPITCDEVVDNGLVDADLWDRVRAAALAVFARGVERGRDAGLVRDRPHVSDAARRPVDAGCTHICCHPWADARRARGVRPLD